MSRISCILAAMVVAEKNRLQRNKIDILELVLFGCRPGGLILILLECGLQNVSNNKKCGPFSAWCVRTNGVRSRPLRIFLWHAKIDFSCDLVILCSRSKS